MLSFADEIEHEMEKLEQLKIIKRAEYIQDTVWRESASLSADTRRMIIVGGLFEQYFPEYKHYKPQESEIENQVEFAPVACFLAVLVQDKEYIQQLKAKVDKALRVIDI